MSPPKEMKCSFCSAMAFTAARRTGAFVTSGSVESVKRASPSATKRNGIAIHCCSSSGWVETGAFVAENCDRGHRDKQYSRKRYSLPNTGHEFVERVYPVWTGLQRDPVGHRYLPVRNSWTSAWKELRRPRNERFGSKASPGRVRYAFSAFLIA